MGNANTLVFNFILWIFGLSAASFFYRYFPIGFDWINEFCGFSFHQFNDKESFFAFPFLYRIRFGI
jgi:hypothetical protein